MLHMYSEHVVRLVVVQCCLLSSSLPAPLTASVGCVKVRGGRGKIRRRREARKREDVDEERGERGRIRRGCSR